MKFYYATIASAVDLRFSSVQCWQIFFFKILYIYFLFEWVVTEHAVSELPGSFRRSAYYIMC
jgi:hypothetical protein